MKGEIGSKSWNNEMYQKHATPYHGIAGLIQERRLKRISKVIKRSSSVSSNYIIEVGCEEGNLLKYLSEECPGYEYKGFDISSEAISAARILLPAEVGLYEYDLTEGPIDLEDDPSFLICSETLEHIPDAEAAVDNIAKSVGDNTIVIITVPIEKHKNKIKKWLIRLRLFNLFFKGIEEALSEWHVQDFSKDDISALLSKHFDIISYDTIFLMHQILVVKKKSNA